MSELPINILNIFSQMHFAYLCTVNAQKFPHITPMFYFFHQENNHITLLSQLKSAKIRNIQTDSQVCLVIDKRDPANPFNNEGIMVEGTAEIMIPQKNIMKDDFESTINQFKKRYPTMKDNTIDSLLTDCLLNVSSSKIIYWKGPNFSTITL